MKECVSCLMLETLRSNHATGTKTLKKNVVVGKTTFQVRHTFWHISLLFLFDYDVKLPNFMFYGGSKQATTKFYFSF